MKYSSKRCLSGVCLLALMFCVAGGNRFLDAQELAVKGGRILPVAGPAIDDGMILIRDGKITAVGKELAIPIEATVIDAKGKTIVPGFVEAHSSGAMSQANERNPNVPFLSVVDSIDPIRGYFEECRRNGVTTAAVVPGNSTMIGGQAAIVKSAGQFVDQMIVRRHAGLKLSLLPSSGSRMSHLAKLRKELDRATAAMKKEAEEKVAAAGGGDAGGSGGSSGASDDDKPKPGGTPSASSRSTTDQDQKLRQAAMEKLLTGELPAFIYCENGMDVLHAVKLTQAYKLKSILVLGRDAYQAADQIAAAKLPVILDPTLVFWKTDPRTGEDEKIVLPEIFGEKKIPVTFQVTGSTATLGSSYLWYQAATAVKYGMPVDEALRSLTQRPAQLLGVDELVGTIEAGKDADLVILTGDPFRVSTWVDTTIVNGKVVYERSKDVKLQKLLGKEDSE